MVRVALTARRQQKLRETLHQALGPEASRVRVVLPDELLAALADWALQDLAGGRTERGKRGKRQVRITRSSLPDEERTHREESLLAQLAATMKRKP